MTSDPLADLSRVLDKAFGPEVPDPPGAPSADRLAAFFGRRTGPAR